MHLEFLVEDSSGARLIECLLPKLLGMAGAEHDWRVHSFKGVGRIPKKLTAHMDPAKATLLGRLAPILRAHGKSVGIDAVVVVVDTDGRVPQAFRDELQALADQCMGASQTLFALATEEIEAWYLGDRTALIQAYPKISKSALKSYDQDSVCGTWELLAEAVRRGGHKALTRNGYQEAGAFKHELAHRVGALMDPSVNESPSFCRFRDDLHRLVAAST